jgi:hypothetical protein
MVGDGGDHGRPGQDMLEPSMPKVDWDGLPGVGEEADDDLVGELARRLGQETVSLVRRKEFAKDERGRCHSLATLPAHDHRVMPAREGFLDDLALSEGPICEIDRHAG